MYVGRTFPVAMLWHFGWRNALRMALLSGAVYAGFEWLGLKWLSIPFLPVSTVGSAVAFYVGFKNNAAYERLWEARRVWGGIVNSSRSLAMSVVSLVGHRGKAAGHAEALRRALIYRQIAWAQALRFQLRQPSTLNASHTALLHITASHKRQPSTTAGDNLAAILAELVPGVDDRPQGGSLTTRLLAEQTKQLAELKRDGSLDEYEHSDLMKQVMECVHHQGAAERIKSYPLPRQYANFSALFVNLFLILLPFGMVREVAAVGAAWMVVPFTVLIGWVFQSMEQVGESSENPFENAINDIPMTTMCRNLEIELKDLLGETKLPERLQPSGDVLM